ncbi:hypothetical protein D3C75_1366830 [compost metagenome]
MTAACCIVPDVAALYPAADGIHGDWQCRLTDRGLLTFVTDGLNLCFHAHGERPE